MSARFISLATIALGVVQALPQPTVAPTATVTSPSEVTVAPRAAAGNPFEGYDFYANPYYSSEVHSLAIPSLPASLHPAASAVANVGSFVWMDTRAKVPTMDEYLAIIKERNAAGEKLMGTFVVYNLPDRDCAALASNGELHIDQNGVELYKTDYIDKIAAIIEKYPDIKINLAIEPDSLANMVTNMNVAKCQRAAPYYRDLTSYALKKLNYDNVDMYLDGGHAGWLGWEANITPAAKMFGEVFKAAGSPRGVRGIVTNVSNYNAWKIGACPALTSPNANCDEERFVKAFAPLLQANGFPAHFIVDVGRSGKQPTAQEQWGDWCNVRGAGFGPRPTTNTGSDLVDAFVWVKPGGESDGTSDTSANRYDAHCGRPSAFKPAPEAGHWFQAYFQMLLENANPPLA
ncbi:glycoside hydrolase family 6 protein [Aaosphaeria arxii CBS 175.79]|uniref:Glucanase n=1 Tax=Aaosphaeria arxii CBS 175.79 TaxID=1450172 RepID=A0A6A5XZN7_9PLEO|nr:glycoside hydrolase family 6 protein [Aaosphaeria arxii CBS 175.79]KAF2018267.1 glycoside hydrolase family 6 protein [Aaosphaeria arxii CBS 175.79]